MLKCRRDNKLSSRMNLKQILTYRDVNQNQNWIFVFQKFILKENLQRIILKKRKKKIKKIFYLSVIRVNSIYDCYRILIKRMFMMNFCHLPQAIKVKIKINYIY